MSRGMRVFLDVVGFIGVIVVGIFMLGMFAYYMTKDETQRRRAVHDHACLSRDMEPVEGIYGSGKGARRFQVCVAKDGALYMVEVK